MSVRNRSESKFKTSIIVDPMIWSEVSKLKTLAHVDASNIVELALRILLAIARVKRIPDDLGEVLSKHDPEALDMLRELIEKLRGC